MDMVKREFEVHLEGLRKAFAECKTNFENMGASYAEEEGYKSLDGLWIELTSLGRDIMQFKSKALNEILKFNLKRR